MSKCIGRAAIVIAVLALMLGNTRMAAAQMTGGAGATPPTVGYNPPAPPDADLQAPATSGPIQLQSIPVTPQAPPDTSVPVPATAQFEHHDSIPALPEIFMHQWSTTHEVPPESLISESYLRTAEQPARGEHHFLGAGEPARPGAEHPCQRFPEGDGSEQTGRP